MVAACLLLMGFASGVLVTAALANAALAHAIVALRQAQQAMRESRQLVHEASVALEGDARTSAEVRH